MGAWEPQCDACRTTLPEPIRIVRKHGKTTFRQRYYTTSDGRKLCADCWKNPANFTLPMMRL